MRQLQASAAIGADVMARYASSKKQEPTGKAIAPSANTLAPRPFGQPAEAVDQSPEVHQIESTPATLSIFAADGGSPPPLQPKLTIGKPNDHYEQEVDRVAEPVVQRIHASGSENQSQATDGLQRSPLIQRQGRLAPEAITGADPQDLENSVYRAKGRGHELTQVAQQDRGGNASTDLLINRSPIAIEQTISGEAVQRARGKAGRIMSDLAFLPLLGVGAIGAEVAARMTFGFEKDRKKIETPTNQLDLQGDKSYVANDIAIAGGGFASKYVLRGRRYDPKPAYAANASVGKAVILLSGSGGPNEDMMEPVAEFYCRQGAVAFGVNYRGYGNSRDVGVFGGESTPFMSEQGLYDDARKIFNYVNQTAGFAPANITLHGFSLGGAVASHLAKKLAKPGPQGQPGVQLGGLVLHSSIKSAYKAARDDVGIPGLAQIAGLGTKGSAGNFDTESHLEQLAARDPNLPIHFMGGNYNAGDQLALSHTQLEQTGAGIFTNVSSHSGQGGHLAQNDTVPQLVDAQGNPRTDHYGMALHPQAVPSGHLSPNMKDKMATLVAEGRARNPNALMNVRAQ